MQNHTKETRMHRLSRHALLSTTLACAALAAQAQNNPGTATAPAAAPAPSAEAAPQPPAPNPAAEKALAQRFQALLAAFEGKAAVPDSKTFTEDFNKQVTADQMKQVFNDVHQSVGSCKVGAQMTSPTPYITSYLLQCDKAYVPMDIGIEEKAPYRVHSLLIRPGYWKK